MCYKGKLSKYSVSYERAPLKTVATLPKSWGHHTYLWDMHKEQWGHISNTWVDPYSKLGMGANNLSQV